MKLERWLIVIAAGLFPLLAGAAPQQTVDNPRPNVGGLQAKVTNPHGPISIPCTECHSYTSWKPIRSNPEFNHDQTGYPLRGMHAKVPCTKCHVSLTFKNISTRCADCHADIHRRQFGANCESCHSVKGWQASLQQIRDHQNRFPLVGAHALLQCDDCHKNAAAGQFTGLSTACYSCHQANFKTPVLNHVAAGFPTTCESCHTMDTWFNAKFDHLKYTGYALTGAHATLSCTACHANNVFAGTPATCYGCHQPDFTGTTNPNHVAAGFPTDCSLCHSTSAWVPSTFNHTSVFPLTGAHTTVACAQCHTNNNYSTLPTTCYGCHQTDWTGTTNPSHAAVGFPTSCDTCHTTTDWVNVNFNHALYANYPLTGAHATLTCIQCHINNNYTNTSTACYSCHQTDFNGTTSPNHVSSGFPTDCSICHSTTAWSPSSFNHNNTAFPLTGAHTTIACTQCHTNNNYTTLPTTCYGCHQSDWNGTTDPNHAAAGFPTTCDTCHTTTAWTGATFNHDNTPFPLTGAHTTVDCVKCHINNVFAGTPTACYSCHAADFTGTTNPNHVSANWPTTCTTCHTTTAWIPATLPASYHTFFPLDHGGANGVCATCHTNSSDYSVFQCTGCHSQSATDGDHRGITGYVYNSVNCYACHKNGGG
jgi:predicted CXXCH cytochrome family protein